MNKKWVPQKGRRSDLMFIEKKKAGKIVTGLAMAGMVAACSSAGPELAKPSKKGKFDPKYGVSASARVASSKSEFRKGGGHYKIGKPYKVAGKRYVPKDEPGYNRTGMASWYGDDFHGRLTANGEIFDMNTLTAAHPTLPLPSYARVTNLKNGRSVIVRINDRGPYAHRRVIDLSKRVAEVLAFKNDGITKVRVKYIGKARMDGLDERYLEASYRGPGQRIGDDYRAVPKEGERRAAPTVMMASAQPAIRRQAPPQPVRNSQPNYILAHVPGYPAPAAPVALAAPAPVLPANTGLAPIDLTGEGYLNLGAQASALQLNYAAKSRISSGHEAISGLMQPEQRSALGRALQKKAGKTFRKEDLSVIGSFPSGYSHRLAKEFAHLAAMDLKPSKDGDVILSVHVLKGGVSWQDIASKRRELGL